MKSLYTHIICRYGEVSLKGKNRRWFEDLLVGDIRKKLGDYLKDIKSVKNDRDGIFISLKSNKDIENILNVLKNVPGISWFAPVVKTENSINEIKDVVVNSIKNLEFDSFKISTVRSDKRLPFTSIKINEEIGGVVIDEYNKKVDLKNPDLDIHIISDKNGAFIFINKIQGMGGLPIRSSGSGVLALSGGIDSPVAGFEMIKRGMELIGAHFHSMPRTSEESVNKVIDISKKLSEIQNPFKLWLVSVSKIQNEITKNCSANLRIVLLRRFMIRISQKIAEIEKAKCIVTGESLGQVASQTIDNISVIENVSNIPIFRPLIGMDKQDIIKIAKNIETYDISIIPHEDCCSLFVPKNPETKAKLDKVEKEEGGIDVCSLVEEAVESATQKMFK